MIGTEAEGSTSPAAILKSTPPPDDAGAATNDRYDWQAAMATADVLAAYLDCLDDAGLVIEGTMFEVLCEHHEDWALVKGHAAEIVSAKHRETQVGPLRSLRILLGEGGVLHLFDRWVALDGTPTCRLVTTAGVTGDVLSLMKAATAVSSPIPVTGSPTR